MLTDEEKIKVAWDCTALPEVITEKTLLAFATMIERAVLAKAMPIPIPKQEPNSDRAMLLQLMHAFDNEHWICEECEHQEDTKTMDSAYFLREYLQSNPVPAQAAAMPEIVRERMNMLFDSINGDAYIGETEERHLVSQIKEWLSASQKPE